VAHSSIKRPKTRMTTLTFLWPVPTGTVKVVSDLPPSMSDGRPVRKAVFEISAISTSSGTQTRAGISEATVAEYAEAMISGDRFPPVVVFRDGGKLILADGFHRIRAARQAGFRKISAEVHIGSRLDALRYSLGCNDKHGLRRTNENKRYAVTVA
jgi:hypothetical protein